MKQCPEHGKLVETLKNLEVKTEHRLTRLEALVVVLGMGSMLEGVILKIGCPWYIDVALFAVILVLIVIILVTIFKRLEVKYERKKQIGG